MGNEAQHERVMAWANMMQDRPHSSAHEHLPNYADFSAVILAQEAEIDQLKKQLSEKHTSDIAAGWSEADAHYGRIEEERNELRESEARCREALESAEHTARKQNAELAEARKLLGMASAELDCWHGAAIEDCEESEDVKRRIDEYLGGSMPREAGGNMDAEEDAGDSSGFEIMAEIDEFMEVECAFHDSTGADRIKELEEDRNRHKKFADVASTEYHKLSQEVTRLREALEDAGKHLAESRLSQALETIDQALAGEKGAGDGQSNQGSAVGIALDGAGSGDADSDSTDSDPAPPSKPLKLNRRQCNASNSTVGGDPAGRLDLANAIFLNKMAHQIEDRDAEIVAAIAELDWHLRHKGDLMNNLNDKIGRYKRSAAAQIADVRRQIDALTEAVLCLYMHAYETGSRGPELHAKLAIAINRLREKGGE